MYRDTGLRPRERKMEKFPHWRAPCPIGCFSVDSERCYIRGRSNLRYFQPPDQNDLPLDLNIGVESAKKKDLNAKEERIDHLLSYIVDYYSTEMKKVLTENRNPQSMHKPLFPIDFVCWRGLLRLIMCTPFEYKSGWIVHVTHYKGTFYFCQKETDEAIFRRSNETPLDKRMCSWGYKFEQYCCSESPDTKPKTNVPVDECAEFACIFHTKIDQFNLFYGAEMDCIRKDPTMSPEIDLPLYQLEFLELKTSLKNMNERQKNSYLRFKTRNWWCQSFLVGIQNIIVGWRDNKGLINDVEEIPVKLLPKLARDWEANGCACFLTSFLNSVKTIMAKVDCPYTVYEFQYNVTNANVAYKNFDDWSDKSFLPDYYINFIENLCKRQERI